MTTSLSSTARHFDTGIEPVGFREKLACRWFGCLQVGRLTVEFPSGAHRTFEGAADGPQALLKIHDLRVITRMLLSGDIGFAESYMDGDWDTPDLTSLLALGATNGEALAGALQASRLVGAVNRLRHAFRANTRRGSRRNIAHHYDLGNDFYELWLDDTMSYSAGLFTDSEEPMVDAQIRKYRRLADELRLEAGDRVLEIGCGWGGFAEIAAAEYGCTVVCLTLPKEQAAYAQARMARLGLAHRVEIRIQDYRDVTGTFDKVVSIEMFEAVGEERWPAYFDVLRRCLKPGGLAGLQVITIAENRFDYYRRTPDFIQRYIFPGGMLPSTSVLEATASASGLAMTDRLFFGESYAETLRRWDQTFLLNGSRLEGIGFDQRFRRMWRYYLSYCEAGFDHGRIDVGQFILEAK